MDMKQILAAFDSAGSKPVTGTNDMKRFVSIIKENSQPQATFTPKVGDEILWRPRNAKMVPTPVTVLAIDAGKLEIKLQSPKLIQRRGGKDTMMIDLNSSEIMPKNDVAEGAAEDLAAIEKHPAADDSRIQKAVADKKKELTTKEEGIHNGLAFKDYFALEEAKKKITAKDDPCWKGYKMVGTKKKGGREVPNCVPGKKGD